MGIDDYFFNQIYEPTKTKIVGLIFKLKMMGKASGKHPG